MEIKEYLLLISVKDLKKNFFNNYSVIFQKTRGLPRFP